MVIVRNISEELAVFTGHEPFEPGEAREVTDEQAEHLACSHLMAIEHPANRQGDDDQPDNKKKNKLFKGVES